MKSNYSIEMDYRRSNKQADKLEEIARKISGESSRMNAGKVDVANCWKGEAAGLYIRKMTVVENELSDISKSLLKTAETIRRISRTIYESEKNAAERARRRNYK